jgi:tight adherence protein B
VIRRLLILLAALTVASASASTADAAKAAQLRLTAVASDFPERTFVVNVPKGFQLSGRKVTVLENGEVVNDLAVAPTSFAGVVLLIDTSESMKGRPLASAMRAARTFVLHRQASQKIAAVTFDAAPKVLLPFSTDGSTIQDALSSLPPVHYYTRMYEAIERAASLVRAENLSTASLILLSDGRELGSRSTQEAALAAAASARLRIFSVALKSRSFDSSTLRTLATSTGGAYFEAGSPGALSEIYDRLGSRLANEYLLQYRSLAGPDEKVTVTVSVAGIDGVATHSYTSPPLPAPAPPALSSSRTDHAARSLVTMLFVAALVAALLGIAVISLIRPQPRGLRRRLGAFVSLARPAEPRRQTSALAEKLLAGTEQSLSGTRWWGGFKHELVVAEIPLPAEQIVVLSVIATLFAGWLFYALVGTAMAILALGLPLIVRWLIKFRAERQRRIFGDQLADNLQVIGSALRAGHSFAGALAVMVEEAPEPSRREFRRVVADEQLGIPLEESLRDTGERMSCRDLEQVAMVAALQRETGGNSAEVLDQVAENIRQRAALRRLVRTLTAQGRMARWIVSSLPVGLLLIILVVNRDYMHPLITRTSGQVVLGFAAVMVIAGSLVIRKIVDIKV